MENERREPLPTPHSGARAGGSRRILLLALLLSLPVVVGCLLIQLSLGIILGRVVARSTPQGAANQQVAHGRYPTGHLTYEAPAGWRTFTYYDQMVTMGSSGYYKCTESCDAPRMGAVVTIWNYHGQGKSTIEEWYQFYAAGISASSGSENVVPLAEYTSLSLGGQSALCTANTAGSQLLPPYPPASADVEARIAEHSSAIAVATCFVLWQERAYRVETSVDLNTASQETDLRDTAKLLMSLRFV